MVVSKLTLYGNVNIGVYIFSNDKLCLVPYGVSGKSLKVIGETLKVPVFKVKVLDSHIIGVFIVGNNKGLLLPKTIGVDEYRKIKRLSEEAGVSVGILNSKNTALGNIILANDHAALVHPGLEEEALETVRDILDVEVERGTIAGIPTVGSAAVVNDKGILLHPETPDSQVESLRSYFKVKNGDVGTINFGIAYVKTGLVVNGNGALVGELTTGPEMVRIEQVFEFTGGKDGG